MVATGGHAFTAVRFTLRDWKQQALGSCCFFLALLAVPGMRLLGSLTQPATHLAVDIRHADVATGMTYGGLVSRPGQIWIWAW